LSVPAIKAALHRGRSRLRELAQTPDDQPLPVLSPVERARLSEYAERFNARDFDAIRDMLADEIRLELVNRTRMKGRKEVATYFGNYSSVSDWWLVSCIDRWAPGPVLVRSSSDPFRAADLFHRPGMVGKPDRQHPGLPLCALRR